MQMDGMGSEKWDIPEYSQPGFAIPHSPSFRSHMRKAARVYWYRWCAQNLKRGDRVSISHETEFGKWNEQVIYRGCNSTHIDITTDDPGNVRMPTCYIIAINKIQESWDDEWL